MVVIYRILFCDRHYNVCDMEYYLSRTDAVTRAASAAAAPVRKRQQWNKVIVSELRVPCSGKACLADVIRFDSPD